MTGQAQLFDHAAACGRLMDLASDPLKKQMLEKTRDLWVALANEHMTMPAGRLTQKIEELSKMQSDLARRARRDLPIQLSRPRFQSSRS